MLGKASTQKHDNLQAFCKLPKGLATYRTALARRRPGVRIPSAPLPEAFTDDSVHVTVGYCDYDEIDPKLRI
jgi:hypothetical protein